MTNKATPRRVAANWHMLLQEEPDNPDLQAQFARWLAADPAHPQAWAAVTQTVATLKQAPPERQHYAMPGVQVPQPAQPNKIKHTFGWLWAGGIGAVAACAVLAVFAPEALLWLRADYYTGYGQTQNVRLVDGSSVQLAPRTALAVNITDNVRTITLLRGEALFSVRHNDQVPFVVVAAGAKATDLGTVFDVQVEQGTTTVAVKEGSSRVEAIKSPGHWHDLHAGEWLSVAGAHSQSGTQSLDRVGAWADGMLIARSLSITDLVARLRPWSHRRIVLLDKALGQKHVTGVYDLSNPLKALQLAVQPHKGRVHTLVPGVMLVTADK